MPKKQLKFWEFKNKITNKSGQNEAELYFYLEIASWGGGYYAHSARSFKSELSSLGKIDVLNVYINSPGGDVFEALAIKSMLKRADCKVRAHIDALAASAATIVCCGADEVIMPSNTMMMIHGASTYVQGNVQDIEETKEVLEKCNEAIKKCYLEKAGDKLDESKVDILMSKDSWLTAQECFELGLCDEVTQAVKLTAKYDVEALDYYNDIPQEIKDIFQEKNQPTNLVVENITNNKGERTMDLKTLKAEHQDIYNQIVAEATSAERNRIKAIEDLAIPGNEEIINKAKFETGITAEAVAVEIIKAQKGKGTEYINQAKKDAENANLLEVNNIEAPGNKKSEEVKDKEAAEYMAKYMNGGIR